MSSRPLKFCPTLDWGVSVQGLQGFADLSYSSYKTESNSERSRHLYNSDCHSQACG